MPSKPRRRLRRLKSEVLEVRHLLAGAPITGFGIAGDSLSDEYAVESYNYARNWDELLVDEQEINFGPEAAYPDYRRTGYAYNWAFYAATTEILLTQGQHIALAGQINAGLVS